MKSFKWIALAAIMMVVMLAPAKANIVVLFNSATPNGGPCPCTWSYEAKLQVGEETSEADNGGPFPTFFTIYDIGGLTSGSELQPAGWTATESLTGTTPAGVSPTDNASIVNITWTYTGPMITPTTEADLGAFTFKSSQFNAGLIISYAQQATKNNPGVGDDDTRDAGIGTVIGPSGVMTGVPEPASVSLLGGALFLAAAGLKRKLQS